MRRMALLAGLLTLTAACGETPMEPLPPAGPSDLIEDGTLNDGNDAFFWLAPIVADPAFSGTFNPDLKPLVAICELDTTLTPAECKAGVTPVKTWTLSTGLRISTTDEHYGFEWHTDQNDDGTATNYDGTYRIQVFLTEAGTERVGFADVQFFSNGQELKDLETGHTITLRDGRTLPGRFRLEQGVSCGGEADCGEAVIGSDGGTVTTESAAAGAAVPEDALDGDILITIRRVDPGAQPWVDCLPTGLRQEEGCYEFDTEPALDDVNEQDAFNVDVTVGVCLDPEAVRPDYLTLHKYDPENAAAGVTELPGAAAGFLSCDGVAMAEPQGIFARLASAAGGLLRPVATLVAGRPLYASDTGRGGLTDAFSFIGWAEPVAVSAADDAPTFALPGAVLSPVIEVVTAHNHPAESVLDASGVTLRVEYTDPLGNTTVLPAVTTDESGEAAPTWTLTEELGSHLLTVSTEQEIADGSGTLVVTDPTEVFTLEVGGYATADACEGQTDCGQGVVGPDGEIVTTDPGHAGVSIPGGALETPVLVTIRRVDPATQPWGDCLPTGLRQEEGCYEFDTEPSLEVANSNDGTFNQLVTVAVCIDPDALRPGNLTLHKYDPEKPQNGVVGLEGAQEGFLTCDTFAYQAPDGLLDRLAAGASRLLAPVGRAVMGRPLYASDTGRGGLTDAFSFIGWAEPIDLAAAVTAPEIALPGATLSPVIEAATAHNHPVESVLDGSGASLRLEYTDPLGNTTVLPPLVTDGSGQATPDWTLTQAVGTHVLSVSTQRTVPAGNGSLLVTDPTTLLTLEVGAYTTAGACGNQTDCGQGVVGPDGEVVTTDPGHAGVSIPQGALDAPVLVTVRRVDPTAQPWDDCLPTGLRQEEGCYEFDTEPALGDVNEQDSFNTDVTVAVCIDPNALREDRLTLHKYDPEKPESGVVELPGATEGFLTCDTFAYDPPTGLLGRFAEGARRILGPVAHVVVGQPLYASDTGRGGLTDAFSFIGWAEPVTLSLATEPDGTTLGITDVVVTATTAHNHNQSPLASDGTTLRFEHTDPSGTVTVSEVSTTGDPATARISLTAQGGTHNVTVSTQQEIIVDSDFLISGATGALGIFAAPTVSFVGVPTAFVVPDPTPVAESGDLTILGLVSRWDADEAGAPFADRVGPNHGGVTGAVDPSATGVQGNAFFFDGSGGMMTAPVAGIADADRFTVAGWVKLDPAGSPFDIQRFVSVGGGNGEKAVLRQESGGTNLARQAHFYGGFGPDDGTGSSLVHIRVPNELVEGCWQHVAGTYDGTQIAFYRDGALVATQDVPLGDREASTIAQQLELGSTLTAGDFPEALWGTLDEVEVHNRALSALEVRELAGRFMPACDVTTGTVGGRVTDAATGEPVPGANVVVEGTGVGTVADVDGRYRIRNVPAGTQTLRVSFIGYEDATQTLTVTAGGFVGADLSIQPAPTFTVSGTVRYIGTGDVLPGIDVTLYSRTARGLRDEDLDATQTDDFGQYTFTGVRDGTYGIDIEDPQRDYFDLTGFRTLGGRSVTVEGGAVVQDMDLVKILNLSQPLDESTVGAQPTLEWEAVAEAASYSVKVLGTGGGTFEGVTGTTFQVPSPLENNTAYVWSVDAFNEAGVQVGTTVQAFDFTVSVAASPIARLTLDSEEGDFIGQGGTFDITYTPDNSESFFARIDRTVESQPAFLSFTLGTVTSDSDNTFASLSFATDQLGIPIQPGIYTDAQRAAFADPGHPGLSVSFQNRACNELVGSFTIHDVTFFSGESGTEIETLSATFEQHCEGAEPALHGTFTYDAHGGS